MTKEELLNKLEIMKNHAYNNWYKIHMKHAGEWHSTHADEPMYYRMKTLEEVIELLKQTE